MQRTPYLLAASGFPSFWRRSVDEFKRLSNIAIKLDGIHGRKGSLALWDFSRPDSVDACVELSDEDIGGYSLARIEHVAQTASDPAHLYFHGNISNRIPPDQTAVERTGYAAWRTRDRPRTMFGKSLWDVDGYRFLAMRIKSDGRKYKVNVQTESIEPTDLHQHRLYTQKPGEWETLLIKWDDFVRTNAGIIVEPQSSMLKEQVRTIGVGLTDRRPGEFSFRISRIWATNELTGSDRDEAAIMGENPIPKDAALNQRA